MTSLQRMACVIVAAKPLSSNRGSSSLSNLRVLEHEIAVGHAHFLLDAPARAGAVWTRMPACETLDRSLESGAVETVRQASRRRS